MCKKRLIAGLITGAILGIFCIIGVGFRLGFLGNELFLFATWVNRVIMGLVIGLAPKIKSNSFTKLTSRGIFFGLIISGSFYLATVFRAPGFFAGIIYGIIIEFVSAKFSN